MTPMDDLKAGEAATAEPRTRDAAEAGNAAVPSRAPASESLATVHGEPSYILSNRDVELAVIRRGGHLAPVRFRLGKRWVEPYALAPWLPDGVDPSLPPVLKVLRGDYLCFPFGGGKGIKDPHGETANEAWNLSQSGSGRLVLDQGGQLRVLLARLP